MTGLVDAHAKTGLLTLKAFYCLEAAILRSFFTSVTKSSIGKEKDMCYNEMGIEPVNLNNEILALSSVQMPREMTTENGCHVSLCFRDEEDPNIHREIARMLIAAFKKRRSSEHETSALSVQSFNQRAG